MERSERQSALADVGPPVEFGTRQILDLGDMDGIVEIGGPPAEEQRRGHHGSSSPQDHQAKDIGAVETRAEVESISHAVVAAVPSGMARPGSPA